MTLALRSHWGAWVIKGAEQVIGSDGTGLGVGGTAPLGLLVRKMGGGGASLGAYRSLGPLSKASGVPRDRGEGRAHLLLGQNGTGRWLCPQERTTLPRPPPPGADLKALRARKSDE